MPTVLRFTPAQMPVSCDSCPPGPAIGESVLLSSVTPGIFAVVGAAGAPLAAIGVSVLLSSVTPPVRRGTLAGDAGGIAGPFAITARVLVAWPPITASPR